MNSLLDKQVGDWLTQNHAAVSLTHPVSIHLNDLLGQLIDGESLPMALQAFLSLFQNLQAIGLLAKPSLVMPLVGLSNQIERAVPQTITELTEQLGLEPPSLYLLDWRTSEHAVEAEAYWSPLPFPLFNPPIDNLQIYYQEIRYSHAIQGDWEFARSIYVEAVGGVRNEPSSQSASRTGGAGDFGDGVRLNH